MSFCHSNPRVKVPIIIGTYPIEDNIDEQSQCNTDNSSQSETNSETSRKYGEILLRCIIAARTALQYDFNLSQIT